MGKLFTRRIVFQLKKTPLAFTELADRVRIDVNDLDYFAGELANLIAIGAVETQDQCFALANSAGVDQPRVEPPQHCPECGSSRIAVRFQCKNCRLDLA